MALNIGAVNFEVDAQTKGLQKAIQQLRQFQKVVDQTAKSQERGAHQAAAALGRQESAIKRAFQQTLNLRRALIQAGGTQHQLAAVSQAFARLTKEMTSGQLSTVEFSRAMDAFNARLNRTSRELKNLQAEKHRKEVSKFTATLRDLESAAVLGLGPLSGMGARIRSLGAIATRSNFALAALLGTIVGITATLGLLAASSVRAEVAFEQMEARFLTATDSSERAANEMRFVIRTARQLGLRINDLGKSYSRLTAASAGTALEGKGTRDVFLGIAKAAAALRLESVEVEGIFRAVEQMISKGTVQAEELRGQMGERLPGAFQRAAAAMNMTTMELGEALRLGTVMAEDFLPKLTAELERALGKRAEENVNSFGGAMNELNNAWMLFNREFDKTFGITNAVIKGIQTLTGLMDTMRENLQTIGRLLGAVAGGLIALTAPSILRGGLFLADALAKAAKGMTALNIAMFASPAGRMAQVFVKLGVAVAGATGGVLLMQALMKDVESLMGEIDEAVDNLGNRPLNLTNRFEDLWRRIRETNEETSLMLKALRTGHIDDAVMFDSLVETRRELRRLTDDELVELERRLREIKAPGEDLEMMLYSLFAANKRAEESFRKLRRQVEATPEVTREINDEFDIMRGRIDALNRGSRAVELFEQQVQRIRAMERMRDQLERMYTTDEKRQEILNEYSKLLDQLAVAQNNFNDSGAQMAAAMVRSLEDIIVAGEGAKEVFRALEKEIVRIALRAFALKPLEQALSSFFGNIGAGAAAKATNSAASAVPNAKGNAFRNGRLQAFARGGVVDRPTLFGMKGGMGLMGEAGSEAILPLTRTSGGDLGVKAEVGNVIVNVYDQRRNSGAQPVTVKQRQDGGMRHLDIFIRDTVKDMANTGELDRVLGKNYGISRRGVR